MAQKCGGQALFVGTENGAGELEETRRGTPSPPCGRCQRQLEGGGGMPPGKGTTPFSVVFPLLGTAEAEEGVSKEAREPSGGGTKL